MSRWPPRPTLSSRFYEAHGLGNDYLVFEEGDDWVATAGNVRRVCARFSGVGSDGLVVLLAGDERGPEPGDRRAHIDVSLRMFNPDGGEFERSGNGLRVLGSFLARRDAALRTITADVGGGRVHMEVHGSVDGVHDISIEMGQARVGPEAVDGDAHAFSPADRSWWLDGPEGARLRVVPVSVGNPHLVVLAAPHEEVSDARLAGLGPFLTAHPALRHGANVQLACSAGEGAAEAVIWERGVGRTSASGTSACAVAVACVHAGLVEPGSVRVEMPGGTLFTTVGASLGVTLRGPVEEVMEGALAPASLARFERG